MTQTIPKGFTYLDMHWSEKLIRFYQLILGQKNDLVFSKGHGLSLPGMYKLIWNNKLEFLHEKFNWWKWFFVSGHSQ